MFFSPFRLDPDNECVWKGSEQRRLKHKSFEVLSYLVRHAGKLVSKEELFEAIWPETHVGDAVLKVCVGEIRKALDDSIAEPRYVETAHRRGYRFIATVTENEAPEAPCLEGVVEREKAFFRLHSALVDAKQGRRQLVFITGEPGIGKTTLVDSFAEQVSSDSTCTITYGQCVDHRGAGEPYFPMLDALSRLCRQPGRQWFVEKLRRHAPTCLAQLPALIAEADRERLKREVVGAAKERMMREMAEAIEAATVESAVVLILEDLHWADHSTIDLIEHLARRREWARLLLVGTYRPADLIVHSHPLRSVTRELQVRGSCSEIALEFLSEQAIGQYLTQRYPGFDSSKLAAMIRQRTDGNPLFMVNILDFMAAKGELAIANGAWELTVPEERAVNDIPNSLQQLIEKQLELLSEHTRGLLQVASVAGLKFSTREIAGAAGLPPDEVESCFEELAFERQFIENAGAMEWPDGAFYRFVHALYRDVLYATVSPTRCIQAHKKLADFLEANYGDSAADIASELAAHFKGSREYLRAVYYLQEAAGSAARRYANAEACEHLQDALDLLRRVPHSERVEPEAAVLDQLGLVRQSAGETKAAIATFEKCVATARSIGRYDLETNALLRLSGALFWTDHERSLETAERAVAVSRSVSDLWWYQQACGHCAARKIRLKGWERHLFEDCAAAVESAREVGDKEMLGLHLMSYSFFLSYQAEYEWACREADEGTELAVESGNAYQYISCQYFKAWALLHAGRWGEVLQLVNEGIELSEKNGHQTGVTFFRVMKAWLNAQAFRYEEASELARQALASNREGFPHFLGLIVLGVSLTGLGRHQAARECFNQIQERKDRGPYCIDWIFHLPFYLGLADLQLSQRLFSEAKETADLLFQFASTSSERTYMALARQILAEAAFAADDFQTADENLRRAFALMDGRDLPLAEWRVNSTAAKLAAKRGADMLADRYLADCAGVLSKLADSLPEREAMRSNMLNSKHVRAVHSCG
jgi:DNA-binding winged helix-turn-helix (wHTH) protein/tetratricopeptide (TPR) repeat protein